MAQQGSPHEISLPNVSIQGIKMIRQLRQSVTGTFDYIREGVPNKESSSNMDVSNEQAFSKELKQNLHSVMESLEHLEKVIAHVPQQKCPLPMGNLYTVMQNYVSDQNSTYEDIFSTYNWVRKIQDYSNYTSRFVNQIVRVNQSAFKKVIPPVSQTVDFGSIHKNLPSLTKAIPGMEATIIQKEKNCSVMLVTVNLVNESFKSPVLKLAILIRMLNMEWVNVKGPDEDFLDDYGKLDIQSSSRHEVFRRIASHTKTTLLHMSSQLYFANSNPLSVQQNMIRQLLGWIHSYRLVYNEPCTVCKQILKDYVPPICRDVRSAITNPQFMHESCRY